MYAKAKPEFRFEGRHKLLYIGQNPSGTNLQDFLTEEVSTPSVNTVPQANVQVDHEEYVQLAELQP